jgi:GRASP55/65 PDZ-like domain
VEANSPAELAGLIPFKDFLLGTAEKVWSRADQHLSQLNPNLSQFNPKPAQRPSRPRTSSNPNPNPKAFKTADILDEELREHLEAPVEFYVYNSDSDDVRTVVLMPSSQWGGEGILGASVASGYLHALPAKCCETIGMSQDLGRR